ncbi:hypothetical protein [Rhizobium sp. BR 315]|uniref:hypothetical protein n=1 Tax=Rhizobium sp. BR 315 TaxID=3040014 RepID=UPI003D336980
MAKGRLVKTGRPFVVECRQSGSTSRASTICSGRHPPDFSERNAEASGKKQFEADDVLRNNRGIDQGYPAVDIVLRRVDMPIAGRTGCGDHHVKRDGEASIQGRSTTAPVSTIGTALDM